MDDGVPEIRRPDQLYALDSIAVPDFVGEGFGDAYRTQVFVFAFRIWEYLWEEDIDTSQYDTASDLDRDHGEAFQAMQDDVGGVSMMQFSAAAGTGMAIHEKGLPEFLDTDRETVLWHPSRTFEWTERDKVLGFVSSWDDERTRDFFERILEDKSAEQIENDEELSVIQDELESISRQMAQEDIGE